MVSTVNFYQKEESYDSSFYFWQMKISAPLISTLCVFALLYALLCGAAYFFQETILFRSTQLPTDFQFRFDLPFEEINLETAPGITINALYFETPNPRGVVLYFHGNAGALNAWGTRAETFIPRNYNLLILDYRGYGKSTGSINSEDNMHHDARVFYNYLTQQKGYTSNQIILYGMSMGTGVAAALASKVPAKALLLEAPYFNMLELTSRYAPFLPLKYLLRYQFRSDLNLEQVRCPIHIIHGTADQVIPYDEGHKLVQKFPHIHFTTVNNGQHNNLRDFSEYEMFLDEALPPLAINDR